MFCHLNKFCRANKLFHVNKESCVWSICTAFCLVYGYGFHNRYEYPLLNPYFFLAFVSLAVVLTFLSGAAMRALCRLSRNLQFHNTRDGKGGMADAEADIKEEFTGEAHTGEECVGKKYIRKKCIRKKRDGEFEGKVNCARYVRNGITALILLAGWIPYWLAAYPGFFTYDATNAFIQHFYGIEYSTHHPLIHSILIADVFKAMLKFFPENYNAGIVVLSWMTMLMGAAVFTYMLDYVYCISGRVIHAAGVIYLTFFPTIGLFASCSTKDTYTAFWMILFVTKLMKLMKLYANMNGKQDSGIKRDPVILALIIVMMLLYRKNILIAYMLFLIFFFLIIKNNRLRWGILFAAGLGGYLLGSGFLEYRYHPAHGAVGEMLCVPLQQMARVYVDEGDVMFTEEELKVFNSFHPYSLSDYHRLNADYVKHDMDDTKLRENLGSFFRMWFRIGVHHPYEYAEAFLVNTYQAWYPFCNITGYSYQSDSTYTYFKCDVEDPGELDSKLPAFYDFLWELCTETSLYEIPVVGILFSIGFYMILLLFVLCYGGYVKSDRIRIFAVFMLAVTFTAMCGPLVLPRYYIYLYYTFPLMLGLMLDKSRVS